MITQINEGYENARMLQALEPDERTLFDDAMRKYATGNSSQQAKLVEAVIRTSRLVANDNGLLPEDVRRTLGTIQQRYRAFASSPGIASSNTYVEARNTLKALFF